MSVECRVNIKSQSELDIGGCETCVLYVHLILVHILEKIPSSFLFSLNIRISSLPKTYTSYPLFLNLFLFSGIASLSSSCLSTES